MYPKTHIILGFFFSLTLILIFSNLTFFEISLIFLSSFLIDVDHYVYYVYKKRDFSLKRAIAWFMKKSKISRNLPKKSRKKFYSGIYFLHGFESILILVLLGMFVCSLFYFIAIGFLFHLILDQIDRIYFYSFPTKLSVFLDLYLCSKS